jgi:hypothetical protein
VATACLDGYPWKHAIALILELRASILCRLSLVANFVLMVGSSYTDVYMITHQLEDLVTIAMEAKRGKLLPRFRDVPESAENFHIEPLAS